MSQYVLNSWIKASAGFNPTKFTQILLPGGKFRSSSELVFDLPDGQNVRVKTDYIPVTIRDMFGQLKMVQKPILRSVDNPGVFVEVQTVIDDVGIPVKIGDDGIPAIDEEVLMKRSKESINQQGVGVLTVEQIKASLAQRQNFIQNTSLYKFLDRMKRNRELNKAAKIRDEFARQREFQQLADELPFAREPAAYFLNKADEAKNAAQLEPSLAMKRKEVIENPNAKPLDEDLAPVSEPVANMVRVKVPSTLASTPKLWTDWFKYKKAPSPAKAAIVEPAPVSNEALVEFVDEVLVQQTAQARSTGKISTRTAQALNIKNSSSWLNRKTLAKGVTGTLVMGALAAEGYLMWYLIRRSMTGAAAEHQKDINGCWMYNKLDGTKVKVKVLSCGDLDYQGALETCATQNYASMAPSDVLECSVNTFNPCIADSASRSTDPAVPLVPNVCSKYIYKGTTPAAVSGVTLIDACKNADGSSLSAKQTCSPYCKSENFNLPENMGLMCMDVDIETAFIDMVQALGYDPVVIFPPKIPVAAAATTFSKPLLITTAVLGFIFSILGILYLYRRRKAVM